MMGKFTLVLVLSTCTFFPVSAQKLIFPVFLGGENNSGALISYNLQSSISSSVNFSGNPEAGDHNIKSGEVGGLKYIASKHAIYGVVTNGATEPLRIDAYGSIFKYDLNTQKFTTLKTFSRNGVDGSKPHRGFTEYNNKLYGMCESGGINNDGVIYYIDLSDDSYHVEFNFNKQTTGAYPTSNIFLSGTTLFGGTKASTDGYGYSIFKYDLLNKNHTLLVNLVGLYPIRIGIPAIMVRNNKVYTAEGHYDITEMNLDGTGYINYYKFLGTNIYTGATPTAFSFSANNGKWYIICNNGGAHNKGSICEMTFQGAKVVNRHSFSNTGLQYPNDGLLDLDNGMLMGVAPNYNGNGHGGLFTFSTNTYLINILRKFNGANGSLAETKPIRVANKIYGITNKGGNLKCGVMYTYNLATQRFEQDIHLGHKLGRSPIYNLAKLNNNEHIGVANRGMNENKGGLYSYDANTHKVKNAYSIDNTDIYDLRSNVVIYNSKYYGIAILEQAVQDNYESVTALYEFDPTTKQYSIIAALDSTGTSKADSRSVFHGNLVLDNNRLFGATSRGLFMYDLSSKLNKVRYVREYNKNTHGSPTSYLTKIGTKIYGANYQGGANNSGTLFSYDINSSNFTILKDFTTMISTPYLGFSVFDNKIYGLFEKGGSQNHGGIYVYNMSTGSLDEAVSFDSTNTGKYPVSELFLASDSMYYGVNEKGGPNNKGVLFQYDPKNNSISTKINLSDITGYGGHHIFFKEIQESTSINNHSLERMNVKLYPNPASETVTFEYITPKDSQQLTLIISNIKGELIERIILPKQTNIYTWKVKNTPPGTYLFTISSTYNVLSSGKLVITQ